MLVYIKPLSIFPELHSDTLFGALTATINELFPKKVDEMIDLFENNNPPFILTSAFPYITDKKIRFYPKLITSNGIDSTIDNDYLKEFKKIEFLEEELFFDIINGKLTENEILNNPDEYFSVKNLLMKKEYENIEFSKAITPHNSVNRLTNESEAIFYSEGNEFENMGLFFFIEFFNEDYVNIIKSALKFLKDKGFGRDVSTGKGQFNYEIEEVSFYDLNDCEGNKFTTLSRFIPTDEDLEMIDSNAAYEIGSKQGKLSSGEIKKRVKFFKEGSTFPNNNNNQQHGKIVKVSENAPAIEYGYAFPVNFGVTK